MIVTVNQTWTSGAFSTTNNYVKFKVKIKEVSYDTTANTSDVIVSVIAYRTNSGYTTYGSGTIDVEIAGVNYHASISPTITDANTTLFSQSATVSHEEDGSLILNTSTEWEINAPGSGGYNYTGTTSAKNFNKTLSTIPRGSTITAPESANMGSSISITVTQAEATFSHKLYYTRPGGSETLIGSYAGTHTYSWTVYNAASSMGATERYQDYTLICYTYFTDDYTGDYVRTETPLQAYVASKPDIWITAIADTLPNGFPYLIGASKIKVTTQSSAYDNATVSQRTVNVSSTGETVGRGGASPTTWTATLTVPLSAASNVVTATVKDTRGLQNTDTATITAVPYTAPTVELRITRADSLGNADAVGTYCKVEAKWTWQSVMNPSEVNGATIKVQVNGTDTATYTTGTNVQTTWTQVALLSGLSITNQYAIKAIITDNVGKSGTAERTLSKADIPLSPYDDGTDVGVTVGRTSTRGGFNVYLDTSLASGKDLILIDPSDDTVINHILVDDLFIIGQETYYHDGDVFHITQGFFSGVLASSNKRIIFTVQLPKKLDLISSVTFTAMNLTVRGRTSSTNGTTTYLPAANTDYMTGYTIGLYNNTMEENTLTIEIEHSTALGGLNNSDLLIAVNDLTVVFNE